MKHTQFWCEGKPDEGIGEALTLTFAAPAKLASLVIQGGVWRDPELFRANNIPTKLDVTTDDGRVKHVTLPEERTEVTVELGGAPVKSLKLAFVAVKKGKMNDTCLSGVALTAAGKDVAILSGLDGAAIASLRETYGKLGAALGDCDEAFLRDHVKLPLAFHNTYQKDAKFKDLKAVLKACKAGTFGGFAMEDPKVDGDASEVSINGYPAFWKLALVGGTWKLSRLEDGTP